MNVVVAVDAPRGRELADELADEGVTVVAVLPAPGRDGPGDPALRAALDEAECLVVAAGRNALTAELVTACDRRGVRILPLADRPAEARVARSFGLVEPLSRAAEGWRVLEALRGAAPRAAPTVERGDVIAVWGPHGAPGRTTIAVELATELARGRGRVALIDADSHAPSIAVALGLADEGPGFAAACRQAELGGLDAAELTRLGVVAGAAGSSPTVLPGINRAGRWPELSPSRVQAALAACRDWAAVTIVDVAAGLEADEEIVSDLDGPRRNGAALAALHAADRVVAVASADPVGIARFLRGYAELRAVVGTTPVTVVVNKLRPGPLGIDARGQVRRTLGRFAGIDDILFVPFDARAADAAALHARAVGEIAPRSSLSVAIRRIAAVLVGEGDRTTEAHGERHSPRRPAWRTRREGLRAVREATAQ